MVFRKNIIRKQMKKLIVDQNVSSTRKFNRYFEKYIKKNGYDVPMTELPTDILTELIAGALMSYTALDLAIDEVFEIQIMDNLTFKCKKTGKYDLVFDIENFKEVLEIPDDDVMLEILANPANSTVLKKDEFFRHPLAELDEKKEHLNLYAFACMIIEAIRHPEDTDDNGEAAESMLTKAVLDSGKPVNTLELIHRIKAGQLKAMMEASTLINEGMTNIFDQEFEN